MVCHEWEMFSLEKSTAWKLRWKCPELASALLKKLKSESIGFFHFMPFASSCCKTFVSYLQTDWTVLKV